MSSLITFPLRPFALPFGEFGKAVVVAAILKKETKTISQNNHFVFPQLLKRYKM